MRTVGHRPLALVLALALLGVAGCGKGAPTAQLTGAGPTRKLAPVAAQGAVSLTTRNTTRLGGPSAVDDAAALARAVYPGLTAATRPTAVVLVNEHDWPAALAAAVLASAPTNAPLLYSEGDALPAVTRETLAALHPLGAPRLGGAQVIRIDTSASLPSGYIPHQLQGGAPASTAAAIAQLAVSLDGTQAPRQVIILSEDASQALAMPAAGLSAESGAPILLVSPGRVPAATAAELVLLHRPSMYVVDAAAVGRHVLHELKHLGPVRLIPSARPPVGASTGTGAGTGTGTGASAGTGAGAAKAATPTLAQAAVENSIEVARFTSGTFGWGVKEPGHGLVFANVGRPLDGPAAALLSATGEYGPLLLLTSADEVPTALVHYLSDIQPAYAGTQFPAVRGAYNHGWLIGDEGAISAVTQAEIDSMLEIVARPQSTEESPAQEAE